MPETEGAEKPFIGNMFFSHSENTLASEVHREASCLEFKAHLSIETMFQMAVGSPYLLLKACLAEDMVVIHFQR